jgi:hypothetical protein
MVPGLHGGDYCAKREYKRTAKPDDDFGPSVAALAESFTLRFGHPSGGSRLISLHGTEHRMPVMII